ncbi:reverse transcriptase domain-containing protein [Tanacetum coccineum]
MSFTIPCQVLEKHKEAEDLAVDHSSRLENLHKDVLTEREVTNKFFDEHLMALKSKSNNDEPWYADLINYIVGKEEPYAFKLFADNIMRRCVAGSETLEILAHCHSGPTGGHHSANVTTKKVYESGFYWTSVFKDANEYVKRCDACQRSGNISSRNKMPQNNIQLFARFGVPKALISDIGTHFCNSQLEKALQRYDVTHKLSTAYHPYSNGQTEVTNRAIKQITDRDGFSFKVNGQRLKKYYEGNIDKEDDEVIEFENGVT